MDAKYMNPLWRALDRVDQMIQKQGNQYDPLTLCDGDTHALGFVATHLVGEQNRNDAEIKASYLLGLAVGFKYAGLPEEKIDELIAAQKD